MPDDQAAGTDRRARWDAELTVLERSVVAAEAAEDDHSHWVPPTDLGPLPAEFRARAERLAVRQRTAVAELHEAKLTVGRHLAAVESVPSERMSAPAIYLDVTG